MLPKDERLSLEALLSLNKLIPVATPADASTALRVAEILSRNSIGIIEIALRNSSALDCVSAVRREFPDIAVGAGSILDEGSMKSARDAGAVFGVSPCCDPLLINGARRLEMDFIPGIATPTELIKALRAGARIIKVFPAEGLGGAGYIRALAAPFGMMEFRLVPTGGVTTANAREYLGIDRVIACGASYMVDTDLLNRNDFIEIESRVKVMAALCRSLGGR